MEFIDFYEFMEAQYLNHVMSGNAIGVWMNFDGEMIIQMFFCNFWLILGYVLNSNAYFIVKILLLFIQLFWNFKTFEIFVFLLFM